MMRVLYFSAFMSAMMVLTNALEAKSDDDKTAKSDLVKRSTFCSHGWTEFNGRCFRYILKQLTWAKAEENCTSQGANLASFHDVEEYQEIQKLTAVSHDYPETWIGGSDAQEEKSWFWIDGTPFHYTNWCRGEPNNLGKEQHCLLMNHKEAKCWDDQTCLHRKPFVCAKKAGEILD